MTRIGIITDAHGNLPATQAALRQLDRLGCDRIIHTGDAIGIGPYPREVLDMLTGRSDVCLLMGNHDAAFLTGMPARRPAWMREGEYELNVWTHAQLPETWLEKIAAFPYEIDLEFGAVRVRFRHYFASPTGAPRASTILEPTPTDLDALTGLPVPDLFFYGHHHPTSDLQGKSRFVNPGALGCPHAGPFEARYAVLTIEGNGEHQVILSGVEYDPAPIWGAFDERDVPGRDEVLRIFFGFPRSH